MVLAPKAVWPFKIKRHITHNTFEIDIPASVRKKMRPVFNSSDLTPLETLDLDPVGALPHRYGAYNPYLLPQEEQELEHALRVPVDHPAWSQPYHSVVDKDFGVVLPEDGAAENPNAPQETLPWLTQPYPLRVILRVR